MAFADMRFAVKVGLSLLILLVSFNNQGVVDRDKEDQQRQPNLDSKTHVSAGHCFLGVCIRSSSEISISLHTQFLWQQRKHEISSLPQRCQISKFATNRLDFQNFKLVRISALIVGWEPKHDTVRYYAKLRVPTGQAIKGWSLWLATESLVLKNYVKVPTIDFLCINHRKSSYY